ncbi:MULTISPECIES: SurA domain containing protein [unclassified Hydrogenobaculum]|uniref:SurA domain containing protein n=1 Tax=unclassified Hydrogenobaculum TaxID=2622382 RepID=UPI0001C50D8B|nr:MULTISPECIES: SurA domain containing protein [unclassified Hydrogenobaculum]AEF18808.1 SurA domain protein [Hydrogenobaculum sp. 3684]AEG46096.1 SurA domain protein [Hydrogenobaculum sp. SHO]AGG14740.1 SurA domain containing protein [Hydrogenobaculum sp. HO]AGH93038.1 SurA family protein [Hydrogenobaculum sp. SN]
MKFYKSKILTSAISILTLINITFAGAKTDKNVDKSHKTINQQSATNNSFEELLHSTPGVLVNRVVASVNGEPILESDLKIAMVYFGTKDAKLALKRLIDIYLIYQYLSENHMATPESFLDQTIKDLASQNNLTIEQLYEELKKQGISPKEFRDFLRKEILATAGFGEYLRKAVKITPSDIELLKLKYGKPKIERDIELLIVPKKDKDKLSKLLNNTTSLKTIASKLNLTPQELEVAKGDLKKNLDEQVWKASKGDIVFAEGKNNIYIAKVKNIKLVYKNIDLDKLKKKLLEEKMKKKYDEILHKLKKESYIKVYLQ